MPIMISIPDDCTPLADALTQSVTSRERAHRRADGGRALDDAHIERELGERPAAVPRGPESILTALDLDAPAVVIDGGSIRASIRAVAGTPRGPGDASCAPAVC